MLFAHAVLLRELPVHGGALVIDVLVGTFLTDTAAYAGDVSSAARWRQHVAQQDGRGPRVGFVGGTMGFWFAGLTRTGCRGSTR